jgi:hypothetical protein
MNLFLITVGLVGAVILGVVLKIRKMPQYKIVSENDKSGKEKWFVKIRKGLSYYYLEQTHDLPGYANDIFATSPHSSGAKETEKLAEGVIINHRMTTVNGIEIEGQ